MMTNEKPRTSRFPNFSNDPSSLSSSSSPPFPTKREFILLSFLLALLVLWPKSGFESDPRRTGNGNEGVGYSNSNEFAEDLELEKGVAYPVVKDTAIRWKGSEVPETRIVSHQPGWTVFEHLYVYKGTIYIITSTPEDVPELKFITSSGSEIWNGEEWVRRRLPSDSDIKVLTPAAAQSLVFSADESKLQIHEASLIPGATFLSTDAPQFIKHYYHFCAELLFGFWRTYTALDPFIPANGQTTLPPPRRLVFRHVGAGNWTDYAAMNQWVLRGAFPMIGLEVKEDWDARAEMDIPMVYERVVLGDRSSSYESEAYLQHWRFTASAFGHRGNMNWWQPLRKSVLEFSGVAPSIVAGPDALQVKTEKYVITYVSRQGWGRRMLRQADHEKLVVELERLQQRYGYELNIVSMDKLSRAEQIALAARTTVMVGVHGNGLTNLLWMRPSPRATVIEIFYPQGFATDYEFTTRALGMQHYGVWNDRVFTKPNTPARQQYPEGFQGNEIPVDGSVVANLIHNRLKLDSEEGDS